MTNPRDASDLRSASNRPTIGHIVALIEVDEAVSAWRRRSIPCTVRTLTRRLYCNFALLPVEPSLVRAKLDIHPTKIGISKGRWNNLRHDLAFILAYAGAIAVPCYSGVPLTPDWRDLIDQVPREGDRRVLQRFARYCIDRHIPPDVVDDNVADAYLHDLLKSSLDRKPRSAHRLALVAWNRGHEIVPDWPDTRLTVPNYRNWWSLPLTAYPESFQKEVDAWLEWLGCGDPFDERARSQPLKPSTIRSKIYHIRYAAGALVSQGRDPVMITSLKDLVVPDPYEAILRHLYRHHGSDSTSSTHAVAVTLMILARDYLRLPAEAIEPLDDLCRKLTPRRTGMTQKNRDRLRPFDDDRLVQRLLRFPPEQFARVRKADRGTQRDALKIQSALLIELLMMAPMRLGNLAAIDLQRHLSWTRDGRKGIVHLAIPGQETKTGEPLEFELPEDTVRLLEIYLREFRSRLCGPTSTWLFPGMNGKHKAIVSLSVQIRRTLLEEIGIDMNAHLFRHFGAMLYLRANPGGYEVVRQVLGHRSINTTVTAYTGMEGAAATKHFDATILKLREASILDIRRQR